MIGTLIIAALLSGVDLPVGSAPDPVSIPHFPDRLHAFVWRNWQLVPIERMAEVVGTQPENIVAVGRSMGLAEPSPISEDQWKRSYITIIRRNWHLLPYNQLLQLLGWDAEKMAYTLREDDFLIIKLGNLKPRCEPLIYENPDPGTRRRAEEISQLVTEFFPGPLPDMEEPLFGFVKDLSKLEGYSRREDASSLFSPRYCYSYFALYGDPLLEEGLDPFPDGYLEKLAASGVNGVWLQGVLFKLAPYPWDESLSSGHNTRLENLKKLVARAKKHGIGVYLYLNEPRSMPVSFFASRKDLLGVTEGDHAAVCTSVASVREYLTDSVASICRAVPDLAGFFTITASENLTNCWSHHRGNECPRCGSRSPAEVIAEVNASILEGIQNAGTMTQLICWDWGWRDDWALEVIDQLPEGTALMSVSEWSIPIERGGVKTVVGEYSISAIGPGPRAKRHWERAQQRGLKTLAKIQANNTWEISAVPYIPAVRNVAEHAANLRKMGLDGLMLSWTLGGYPSPNLEVVAEMGRKEAPALEQAMKEVALRRFGPDLAAHVVRAWEDFSTAFSEFPYDSGSLYNGPQQMGPANLLWEKPTGFRSTMVGLPYDDLDRWTTAYPAETFVSQFEKMADGFAGAFSGLKRSSAELDLSPQWARALSKEMNVAEACEIHFRSVANQCAFILARDRLLSTTRSDEAKTLIAELEDLLESEIDLARRLYSIQARDSRIGFEASNHYFYIHLDLAEKVINCTDLLGRWLPEQRKRVID